jgi:uncharacterized lipoprotein YmbA
MSREQVGWARVLRVARPLTRPSATLSPLDAGRGATSSLLGTGHLFSGLIAPDGAFARRFFVRRTMTVIVLLLLLPGCGFFSRPPNQFYSLQTVRSEAPVVSIGSLPVGIDGIELPPGIDRRGIVVRGADHKLEVRGTHQWSSSLEEMVIHTLAFNIANRTAEGSVVLPGQVKPAAMRSIFVTFEELAPGADSVFVLDARWSVTGRGAPVVTTHERISVQLDSMDSERIAAGMSTALATLADRIVARLAGG